MKFGLFPLNFYACSDPGTAERVARATEEAGFESLWVGDRLAAPDPRVPPSAAEPTDRMLDAFISLAFLAAHTSRVLLGTGVVVLPLRQPLVLAKQIASVDALSGGRLLFGLGVGLLEPEFRAAGVPFDDRGARSDEYLAAMRAMWGGDAPAFEGRFVSLGGVTAHPQPERVPIVVGGHSKAALRRAITLGDGWYGFGAELDETEAMVTELRRAEAAGERPPGLGRLEITVSLRGRVDPALAERLGAIGVDRIVLLSRRDQDEAGLLRLVENAARALIEPGA